MRIGGRKIIVGIERDAVANVPHQNKLTTPSL
jgi:hypothetical protein